MKTHTLAQHLENTAKLLRSLPNIEAGHVLSNIIRGLDAKNIKVAVSKTKNADDYSKNVRDGLELELGELSPGELKSYFASDAEGKTLTKKDLTVIACRLGLITSKTQTRDAIINQLIRHIEANNLDGIIRSRAHKMEELPICDKSKNEKGNQD